MTEDWQKRLDRIVTATRDAYGDGHVKYAGALNEAVSLLKMMKEHMDGLVARDKELQPALERLYSIALHVATEHLPAEDEPAFEVHAVEMDGALTQAEAVLFGPEYRREVKS
jgi:hypothetical protein